jgi:soluble lytic murein transglycosylase-like protein
VAESKGNKARALSLWNEVLRNDPNGYYGYLARSRLLERGVDPKQLQMVSAPPTPPTAVAAPTDVPGDLKLVDDAVETVTPEVGAVTPIFRDTPSVTLSPIPSSAERAETLPDLSELVREFPELLPPLAKGEPRREAAVSPPPAAEPADNDGEAADDAAEAPAGPDVTAEAVAQNPVAAYASVAARFGKKALPLTRAAELRALGLKEDAARELRATIAATGGWGVSARTLGQSWKGRKEARRAGRIAPLPMQAYREIGQLAREAGDAHLAMKLLPGPDGDRRWYPQAYRALVTKVAGEYDVPPSLLWALMRTESAFQNYVTSRAGARGLMQIMPKTGRNIARTLGYEIWSPDALYDPEISLRFAGWYVRQLIDKFKGQLPLAIGSYNGGPHNVARWLLAKGQKTALDEFVEEIPFRETRGYVKKVLRVMAQYQRLYENRNDLVVTQKLNVDVGTNINY